MKGLDLRKFRKVSADDDFTTLSHYAGHEIRVAHKKLSKAHRSQLDGLPMAKGGKVPKSGDKGPWVDPEAARQMEAGATGRQPPKSEVTQGEGYTSTPVRNPSHDPDAAKRDSIERQKAKFNSQVNQPVQGYADGGKIQDIELQEPEITDIDYGTLPDSPEPMDLTLPDAPEPNKSSDIYNSRMDFYKQNTPGMPEQSMRGDALSEAERIKNIDEYKASQAKESAGADYSRAEAENQRRSALGMEPLPLPAAPAQEGARQPAAEPEAAAPAPAAPQQPQQPQTAPSQSSSLISDFDRQTKAQAKILEDSVKEQDSIIKEAHKNYEASKADFANFMHDVQTQQIDPDRLWNSKTDLGRAATIMGIMLAGFSPAARPNAAIEELDKAIDRDIDSQKAELGKKQTLLSMNMQHSRDLNQALEMTKTMQMGAMAEKMKAAALKAGDPASKAKILQDIAGYETAIAARVEKQAQQKALSQAMEIAKKDPSKAQTVAEAVSRVDPKTGEDLLARATPYGFANTKEDGTKAKEVAARKTEMLLNIEKLQSMIGGPKGKGTYELLGSHNQDMDRLLDAVAVDQAKLQDPDSIARPGEVELARKSLPNVGMFSNKNSTAVKLLENFKKETESRANSRLKLYGLNPPESPKSPEYQTMGGVKYMKVSGGWKKAQ